MGAMVTPPAQQSDPMPSSDRMVDIRARYWIVMLISVLVCGGFFLAPPMHTSGDWFLFVIALGLLLPLGQLFVSFIVWISTYTLQPAQRPAARKQLGSLTKRALLGTFCGSVAMFALLLLQSAVRHHLHRLLGLFGL